MSRIESLIQRLRLPPDMELRVGMDTERWCEGPSGLRTNFVEICAVWHRPDVRDPEVTVPIELRRRLSPRESEQMHEAALMQMLRHMLIELMAHEVDEWLALDGAQVTPVHRGG